MSDTNQTHPEEMEQQQALKKSALRRDRIWMGLGTILYQSEESGFQSGPVPTAIVRALGGDDRHLGILGGIATVGSLGHLMGSHLLRRTESNRAAMILALWIGTAFATALSGLLLLGNIVGLRAVILPMFLGGFMLFASVNGMQSNIETGWVGDLVPLKLRGWFTKVKWMLSVLGFLLFSIGIARFSQQFPGFVGYAAIFATFAGSFVLAAMIFYPRVTDAQPHSVRFLGQSTNRITYRSSVFWWLVLQGLLWTVGRNMAFAFMSAYLMDQFHFSLTKVALLVSLQQASSVVVIFAIGDHTDRWGARKPLMLLMSGVALSMSLWILSAWWGIGCIIAYYVLNGAAGQTLTMLGNNYSLEVFPSRGRAAYLALSRMIGGVASFVMVLCSGWLVHHLRDFQFVLAGHSLSRYHAAFAAGMVIALCSQIPFLMIGNRKMQPAQ